MAAALDALHAFLSDALRMSAEASECVSRLAEQAQQKRVSPALIHGLYQTIHTLKGTASMIKGGSGIVDALHQIESKLACQTTMESARNPDWLILAQRSLRETRAALIELQRLERLKPTVSTGNQVPKGLVVKAQCHGKECLFWFALSMVSRIFPPYELLGREVISLEGRLVPILGEHPLISEGGNLIRGPWKGSDEAPAPELRKGASLGLGIKSEVGQAVLMVSVVNTVSTWPEALKLGAADGLQYYFGAQAA